jgi:hypothetical protein
MAHLPICFFEVNDLPPGRACSQDRDRLARPGRGLVMRLPKGGENRRFGAASWPHLPFFAVNRLALTMTESNIRDMFDSMASV